MIPLNFIGGIPIGGGSIFADLSGYEEVQLVQAPPMRMYVAFGLLLVVAAVVILRARKHEYALLNCRYASSGIHKDSFVCECGTPLGTSLPEEVPLRCPSCSLPLWNRC